MLLAACIIFAILGVSSGETVVKKLSLRERRVTFTAECHSVCKIKNGSTLVVNKVFTNHGGGYNSSTGVFIAPKSGMYLFHMYALTTRYTFFIIVLYHNNENGIYVFAYPGYYYPATNAAILRLKKSDRVYLKVVDASSFNGRLDEVYITFGGYRFAMPADGGDV